MTGIWRVSEMQISLSHVDEIPIIEARGECDLVTSRKLESAGEALIDGGNARVVLDLGGMTYIDSSGFRVLVGLQRKARAAGGGIALSCLPARVKRVFDIMGLEALISTAETVEEAAALLKPRKPAGCESK